MQGQRLCTSIGSSSRPCRSPSPPSQSRRGEFYLPPRFPLVHEGSTIIRGLTFPKGFFYKYNLEGHFEPLTGHNCDAVVNNRQRIVAIFRESWEKTLYGVYFGEKEPRMELNPWSLDREHYEPLDALSYDLYREFEDYDKPEEMILGSLQDYLAIHRHCDRSTCDHGPEPQKILRKLQPGTILIAGVPFPEGFFFAVRRLGPYKSLVGYNCDAVVDVRSGRIVAVFLGPKEDMLHGIYRGKGGGRVELMKLSMDENVFAYLDEVGYTLYAEYYNFKKPQKLYKEILHEYLLPDAGIPHAEIHHAEISPAWE